MNATEAYSRVYPNVTRESARRKGSLLLTNVDVSAEITQRLKENQISADEVLTRIAEQAKGEYAKYIREDGSVNISQMVNDGKGHLIRKVKRTVRTDREGNQTEYTEIEFYDGQKALELAGKYHSLFTDKVDVTSEGKSIAEMKPSEIALKVSELLAVTKKNERS
jgi:phage terminase small subunit